MFAKQVKVWGYGPGNLVVAGWTMYWLKTAPVGDPGIRGEEQLRVDDKGTNKQIAQAEQNKQKKNQQIAIFTRKATHQHR